MSASAINVGAWWAFTALAGPVLAVTLLIGLLAGLLQTATQIREASIPFVLKLMGMAALTTAAGPLMMRHVDGYAAGLILAIPGIIHG